MFQQAGRILRRIQLTLPEDFTRDREFAAILSFARDAGLSELPLTRFAEIVAAVGRSPVPVLIEATNRRESSVVNTLEEAARLLAACRCTTPSTFPTTTGSSQASAASSSRVRTGARSWRTCP